MHDDGTHSEVVESDPGGRVEAAVFHALESDDPDLALAEQPLPEDLRARAQSVLDRLRREELVPPRLSQVPDRLGSFRLLRSLGSGGMGIVYVAEQEGLGRTVALKLIRPEHLYFPGSRRRFRREIEAAAQLQHQGVATVLTAGEEAGLPYFVMEHVDGSSLAAVLLGFAGRSPEGLTGTELRAACDTSVDGATPTSDGSDARSLFGGTWTEVALRIATRVAEALVHAHERGVLHRDVKPSNVIVTAAGRVCLVDFGLAWLEGDAGLTATTTRLGSLPYLPPESIRGDRRNASPQQDVYALGVTLWEMLALRSAFGGGPAEAIERRVLDARPPRLRALNREVSVDLQTVCQCAMDPELGRRYASMSAFLDDLRAVANGRTIAARRAGPVRIALRFAQRHPSLAAAVLVGVLLLLAGSALWALRERDARRLADALTAEARSEAYVAGIASAEASLAPPRVDSSAAHRSLSAAPAEHRRWEWRHLALVQDSSEATFELGLRTRGITVLGDRLLGVGPSELVVARDDGRRVVWRVAVPDTAGAFAVHGELIAHGRNDGAVVLRAFGDGEEVGVLQDDMAHADLVSALAFLDDGRVLVSGDTSGRIALWDVESGQLREARTIHGQYVRALTAGRDGSTFASASTDRTVVVSTLDPAVEPVRIPLGFWPSDVRFVADDAIVAVAGGSQLSFWSAKEGISIAAYAIPATRLALSSDGRRLAFITMREDCGVFDVTDPSAALRVSSPILNVRQPSALAWEGTTSRLVVVGEDGLAAWCRPLERAATRAARAHARMVTAAAVAAGGILSGDSEGRLVVTDADTLATRSLDLDQGGAVRVIEASPDGVQVLVAWTNGVVRSLDGRTFELQGLLDFAPPLTAAALLPVNAGLIVAHAQGRVVVTDHKGGRSQTLRDSGPPVTHLRVANHGGAIAVSDEGGNLEVLARDGTSIARFHAEGVWLADAIFLDDGTRVAAACADGLIRIWSLTDTSAPPIELAGHTRAPVALAVTRDGRLLSAGGYDQTLRVWDVEKPRQLVAIRSGTAMFALCADARSDLVVTGHLSHELQLWSTRGDLGRSSADGRATLDTVTKPPSTRSDR